MKTAVVVLTPMPHILTNQACRGLRSVAKEQGQPPADDCDWENDACRGITQIPDPVSDKNLVDDVVETGNDQRKYAWNRKFP